MGTGPAIASLAIETKTKLRRRLLPYVLLLFVVALIDRNNVSFAALTMNKELQSGRVGAYLIGSAMQAVKLGLKQLLFVRAYRWLTPVVQSLLSTRVTI